MMMKFLTPGWVDMLVDNRVANCDNQADEEKLVRVVDQKVLVSLGCQIVKKTKRPTSSTCQVLLTWLLTWLGSG